MTCMLLSQASKWNEIGLALAVPHDFRRGLRQENSSNIIKLEDVIAKWIESQCSEVSWNHLIAVLRGEQLEMVEVAKAVKDYAYQVIEEPPNTKRFKPSTSPESSHPTIVSLPAVEQLEASSSNSTQANTGQREKYWYDHSLSGSTLVPTESSISTEHAHTINELPMSIYLTICQSAPGALTSPSIVPTQISALKPISTITINELPSLQSQISTNSTIICNQEQLHLFEKTLKGLYKRKSPSYSKKPSPFLKYINLLLVQPKKGESTRDKKASMRHKIIGDTRLNEELSHKKCPIKIDDICKSPGNCNRACPCLVLIKGDPGVGKTTLAWELCVRWAEGSLLQEWKIVKFVQLRAKEVREAKTIESLLDPYNEHGGFCKYITNLGGEGMLLIFDGFDELSHEQLKESSLFMRLLEGKTFSKASIIVTSRPSAVQLIPEIFMNNLEQLIEVVGFAKEDIKEYIECKFEDNAGALDAFNDYVSSHEFIFTLMYVPLHCALITDLYEEYQREKMEFEPKTLTQLYTCFIHCLIQRNTGFRVHDINKLPHDLKDKFKELAQIAAEGIKTRQYVFDIGIDDKFGMLQRVDTSSKCGTVQSVSCSFLHLTLQEYLAAYHWSIAPPLEVAGLFKASGALPIEKYFQPAGQKKTKTMSKSYLHWPALHFYSGLTGVMETPLEIEVTKPKLRNSRNSTDFNFFCFLFESQSTTLVSLVFPQESIMTTVTTIRSSKDAYVTGFCIARAMESVKWKITMKKSGFIKNLVDGIKHAKLENFKGSFIHHLEILEGSSDCDFFKYFYYIEQISEFVKDLCLTYKSELVRWNSESFDHTSNRSFNLIKFSYDRKTHGSDYNKEVGFAQSLFSTLTCVKTLRLAMFSICIPNTKASIIIDDEGSACISQENLLLGTIEGQYSFRNNISLSSLSPAYTGFIPYAVVKNSNKHTDFFGFGFLEHGYDLFLDRAHDMNNPQQSNLQFIFKLIYTPKMTLSPADKFNEKINVTLFDVSHRFLFCHSDFLIYFYHTEAKKWTELRINTSGNSDIMMLVNEDNTELLIDILKRIGKLRLVDDSCDLIQPLKGLNIFGKKEVKTSIDIDAIKILIETDVRNANHSHLDVVSHVHSSCTKEFFKWKVTINHLKEILKETEFCSLIHTCIASKLRSLSIVVDKSNSNHDHHVDTLVKFTKTLLTCTELKEFKVIVYGACMINNNKIGEVICEIMKSNLSLEVVDISDSAKESLKNLRIYEGIMNLTKLKVLIVRQSCMTDELWKAMLHFVAGKVPIHSTVVFYNCHFTKSQYTELLDIAGSTESEIYIHEWGSKVKDIRETTFKISNTSTKCSRILLALQPNSVTASEIYRELNLYYNQQVTIVSSKQFDEHVESLKMYS